MRILGVDPGLNITGYGVITAEKRQFKLLEAGIVKNTSRQSLQERLLCLYKTLRAIIREYNPAALILENLYSHYKHQMTAVAMAHARGVIVLTAAECADLRLVHYSAKRVKKALTGNGNASKIQVARTVQGILKLAEIPSPLDVSDALALAIAHAYIAGVEHRA